MLVMVMRAAVVEADVVGVVVLLVVAASLAEVAQW